MTSDVMAELGETIRLVRKERHLKQKQLAALAGISSNALSSIEKGYSFPTQEHLKKLAEAMQISLGGLICRCLTEDDIPEEKRAVFRLFVPLILADFDASKIRITICK